MKQETKKPMWNHRQNCYHYAWGLRSQDLAWNALQPGFLAGRTDPFQHECGAVIQRVLEDNIGDTFRHPCAQPCPEGYHKVGLAVDPDRDYHFYRQDNGLWTHKPGRRPVRRLASGKNPWEIRRHYGRYKYDDWCGCFCTKTDQQMGF